MFPKKPALVDAWIAFHSGHFARAARLGLDVDVGVEEYSVAHKAIYICNNYLEPNERKKFARFEEVAERCERHQFEQPDNPAGYYYDENSGLSDTTACGFLRGVEGMRALGQ